MCLDQIRLCPWSSHKHITKVSSGMHRHLHSLFFFVFRGNPWETDTERELWLIDDPQHMELAQNKHLSKVIKCIYFALSYISYKFSYTTSIKSPPSYWYKYRCLNWRQTETTSMCHSSHNMVSVVVGDNKHIMWIKSYHNNNLLQAVVSDNHFILVLHCCTIAYHAWH